MHQIDPFNSQKGTRTPNQDPNKDREGDEIMSMGWDSDNSTETGTRSSADADIPARRLGLRS